MNTSAISNNLFMMQTFVKENHLTPLLLLLIVSLVLSMSVYSKYIKSLSKEQLDAHNKRFAIGIITVMSLVLMALKAYMLLVAVVLLIASYMIVLANKRYENIKRKIDDLF